MGCFENCGETFYFKSIEYIILGLHLMQLVWMTEIFFFFLREFLFMTSALNDSFLLSDQDINQSLV